MIPKAILTTALTLTLAITSTTQADPTTYTTGNNTTQNSHFTNTQPTLALNQYMIQSSNSNAIDFYDLHRIRTSAASRNPENAYDMAGYLLPINSNTENLFSLIGTTYGGDGRTSYALPNLRGRLSSQYTLGQTLGNQNITLNTNQLPPHNHNIANVFDNNTSNTGSANPIDNRQPTLGTNFFVSTTGHYPSRTGSFTDQQFYGKIAQFAGNDVDDSWTRADGRLLSIAQNQELFSIYGNNFGGDGRTTFGLPNLNDTIPVGIGRAPGSRYDVRIGQNIGQNQITLNQNNLPSHNHTMPFGPDTHTGNTENNIPFSNFQKSLGINYLVALQGQYPSNNSVGSETTLGEIVMFGGNYAPTGYALAQGQLLPIIEENYALFSIFGTMYGGNGRTTFGLPDLRSRAIVNQGRGPGLPSWQVGQKSGQEFITLNENNLPQHNHEFILQSKTGLSASDTDNIVNQEDLDNLIHSFGQDASTNPHLTGNIIIESGKFSTTIIGLEQLATLRNHFNTNYNLPTSSIPEPTTLLLLTTATPLLLKRKK